MHRTTTRVYFNIDRRECKNNNFSDILRCANELPIRSAANEFGSRILFYITVMPPMNF